jgi:ribose/xylose/arabinose/galactoside ABC-type transport system permease subunit
VSASSATVTDLELQRRRAEEDADRAARRASLIDRSGVIAPFLLVLVLGALFAPNFISVANLRSILANAAILMVVGYGMTLVVAIGGIIDLSVGPVTALTSVLAAAVINAAGLPVGIAAAIAIGGLIGAVNGLLITRLRIPPFVATLATMSAIRGVALVFTGGQRIQLQDDSLRLLSSARILEIPPSFLIAVALGVAVFVLLERTPVGRHICAVGGKPEAAREAGLSVDAVRVAVFTASGLAAAISGVLLTAQLGTVDATPISGLELQALAITVLGGTSLRGGAGNIPGTFLAALLLGMINAELNLLNIPGYYQYLAVGILLLAALSLDSVRVGSGLRWGRTGGERDAG